MLDGKEIILSFRDLAIASLSENHPWHPFFLSLREQIRNRSIRFNFFTQDHGKIENEPFFKKCFESRVQFSKLDKKRIDESFSRCYNQCDITGRIIKESIELITNFYIHSRQSLPS
jgi:hypothetical protein